MIRFQQILYLAVALVLATQATASRAAIVPANGLLNFAVTRNGEKIGSHVLTFHKADNRINVDIYTQIAVKFTFVTLYRFEYDGHEVWENGKLVGMKTKTHDDGTDHTLTASTNGAGGFTWSAMARSWRPRLTPSRRASGTRPLSGPVP